MLLECEMGPNGLYRFPSDVKPPCVCSAAKLASPFGAVQFAGGSAVHEFR